MQASAQVFQPNPWSNLRIRTINSLQPYQILDTLSIAWPLVGLSDSVSGKQIPLYLAHISNETLRLDTAGIRRICPDCRRLTVTYRVLPVRMGGVLRRLDTTLIRRPGVHDAIEFDYSPYEPPQRPWETGTLTTNGSYSRGLSFGNNQNLVFNSNLNLQLNGKLGDDIEVQAALSDNSIPLQPDGTTRQIQEFDRIFIQLKRRNASLTAGDYDLSRPYGYFSNYFKRFQGAAVDLQKQGLAWKAPGGPRDTVTTRITAALSRGKFARQIIQGQEGNQGPYRLQGAEGERYIIVLAGTEKVFVDGQQLVRGLNDDYVIDYNLGELTFTARRLITKDSRIIVEFEYAVQVYTRSAIALQSLWAMPGGKLYFNFYSEQDSRNGGGAQELNAGQRQRLAEVGDNLDLAYASGIDTVEEAFDPSRIYYRAIDTIICGQPGQILIYTNNPDSARFTVRFSEVPAGAGRYVQAIASANGRVFRWAGVDPFTCQPTGNYEPVIRLIAPEQRQLIALGGERRFKNRGFAAGEMAVSNRDLNRFSPLGNTDNRGLAGWIRFKQPLTAGNKPWQIAVGGQYEFAAAQFRALNPYRPAEFSRDWNLNGQIDTAAEHWARGGITVSRANWFVGQYEFSTFIRADSYEGSRYFGQTRLQKAGIDIIAEFNALNSKGIQENTRFSRPKFDFSKTFFIGKEKKPWLKIGVYGERERNERRLLGGDTLLGASFWYDLGRVYLQKPETPGFWRWQVSIGERRDYAPVADNFQKSTTAKDIQASGSWNNAPEGIKTTPAILQKLEWQGTWRRLSIDAGELTVQEAQETYLGRIDYGLTAFKNALQLTTGYEIGAGQSPKLEFNYLRVNPGEGQYTWVDRNRDSILQLDEMEVAVFSDQATYVRIAVTTTEYIRTNNVLLNQSFRFDPRLLWGTNPKGWRRWMRRLSLQSNAQLNRRVLAETAGAGAWNPFYRELPDTALIAIGVTQRHVLFVNRANPAWDVSFTWSEARNRTFQTTGFESRLFSEALIHTRVNLSKQWSAEADANWGNRNSDHQLFNNRDYSIDFWEAGPRLTWIPGRNFRLVGKYTQRQSRNIIGMLESAGQTEWQVEMTWNPTAAVKNGFQAATSFRGQASYNQIRFSGEANTPVAYAMLEGLQNGRNFLWSLSIDRQLSSTIQLSIQYEGRKTGENQPVHIGRAQVRALF